MKIKVNVSLARLAPALLAVFAFSAGVSAQGVTKEWDGSEGNSWDNADNWTPAGVPGADDDVEIPGDSGSIEVSGPIEVGSIDMKDSPSFAGSSLNAPQGSNLEITTNGKFRVGKNNFVRAPNGDQNNPAGKVDIDAIGDFINRGTIGGGIGNTPWAGVGGAGSGGGIRIRGKTVDNSTGKIQGGAGGADSGSGSEAGKGGDGGNVDIEAETGKIQGDDIKGGEKGQGSPDGTAGTVNDAGAGGTEPVIGSTSTTTGEVIQVNAGSQGWIDLSSRSALAYDAHDRLLINAGSNGVIDLRGNPAGTLVLSAQNSITLQGTVLLDPGVTLADLTEPDAVMAGSIQLKIDRLQAGTLAELRLWGLNPGEFGHFIYSLNGTGAGPCVPSLGGLCLDLLNPVTLIGSAPAGVDGIARKPVPIPVNVPPIPVFLQAVVARGAGGADSLSSNVQIAYLLD